MTREEVGADAARLARTAGVTDPRKILAALDALPTVEEKARALLRLARSGVPEAVAFVEGAAAGDCGKALRVPAVLALAGAGEAAVSLLAEIAGDPGDPAVAGAAVLALRLSGRADAQTAIACVLEGRAGAGGRIAVYEALGGGVPGLALGHALVSDLETEPGSTELHPDARLPGPYRRLVAAVASEPDPAAQAAAARVLAGLREPVAKDGLLSLWSRTEVEMRERVFEAVLAELPPRDGVTLARLAAAAPGEVGVELRRRALGRIREAGGPDLAGALRDWADTETDPGLKDELAAEIARVAAAPGEEDR